VSSLFVASSHISLYVADVQVIELPWWAKLLKIVQALLYIFALLTLLSAGVTGAAIAAMIKKVVINLVLKEAVSYIAKEISPELAIVVSIWLGYKLSSGKEIDFSNFGDVAKLLNNTTDIMLSAVESYTSSETEDLLKEQQYEEDRQKRLEQELLDKEAELNLNTLDWLELVDVSIVSSISPMMPTEYIAYNLNKSTMALESYNYDNPYTTLYENPEMFT